MVFKSNTRTTSIPSSGEKMDKTNGKEHTVTLDDEEKSAGISVRFCCLRESGRREREREPEELRKELERND